MTDSDSSADGDVTADAFGALALYLCTVGWVPASALSVESVGESAAFGAGAACDSSVVSGLEVV